MVASCKTCSNSFVQFSALSLSLFSLYPTSFYLLSSPCISRSSRDLTKLDRIQSIILTWNWASGKRGWHGEKGGGSNNSFVSSFLKLTWVIASRRRKAEMWGESRRICRRIFSSNCMNTRSTDMRYDIKLFQTRVTLKKIRIFIERWYSL